MTAWLAAIASLGTIVGGLVYLSRMVSRAVVKTPEEEKQAIDQQNNGDQAKVEQGGRPV